MDGPICAYQPCQSPVSRTQSLIACFDCIPFVYLEYNLTNKDRTIESTFPVTIVNCNLYMCILHVSIAFSVFVAEVKKGKQDKLLDKLDQQKMTGIEKSNRLSRAVGAFKVPPLKGAIKAWNGTNLCWHSLAPPNRSDSIRFDAVFVSQWRQSTVSVVLIRPFYWIWPMVCTVGPPKPPNQHPLPFSSCKDNAAMLR